MDIDRKRNFDFEDYLRQQVPDDLKEVFKRALDEVCEGCDRAFIVASFAMRMEPGFVPEDQWETSAAWSLPIADSSIEQTPARMTDRPREAGFFRPEDIKRIEDESSDCLADIRRLRSTLWIRLLVNSGRIQPGDLLHPDSSLECFDGLLHIGRWASKTLPAKRRPSENELLEEIVRHVHEHSKIWRDRALGDLHYTLRLPHQNEDSMKSWRKARNLR